MAAGSGYDFIVDTGKLVDFAEGLEKYYESLDINISELRSFFGEGNTDTRWSGEAYDTLKAKYDTSAKSYDAVLSYINSYKNMVSNVEASAAKLCADIAAVCDLGR